MLISGDDPVALPMIAMGAVGVISVIGNAIPLQLSEMIRQCLNGKFQEALPAHLSLIEFTRLLFAEGNPAGVKAALKLREVCGDQLRLPLVRVSAKLEAEIAAQLSKII
jgi:4-hydroxy-tetrahydrodipicolinate synthase